MIGTAFIVLRALVRASQRATRGGERHEIAAPTSTTLENAAARGSVVDPEPGACSDSSTTPEATESEDLVGAPAAYVMPTVIPYVQPSQIRRRCEDCGAHRTVGVFLTDDAEPVDLYWIPGLPELFCAPCATKRGFDVSLLPSRQTEEVST